MSDRMRRIDEAVREVLSEQISRLTDPRIGFVTVTGVQTSPDLKHARVYVSVLGKPSAQKLGLAGLESAHGILQRAVARQLRIKNTPTLEFLLDQSPEHGQRIEELIREHDPSSSPLG